MRERKPHPQTILHKIEHMFNRAANVKYFHFPRPVSDWD